MQHFPEFSFHRLKGADPKLGIEMASTGEVGCIGSNIHEAFLSAMISVGIKIPKQTILVSLGSIEDKVEFLEAMEILQHLGYKVYATTGTHKLFQKHGYSTKSISKLSEDKKHNAVTLLESKKIDLFINTPSTKDIAEEEHDGYMLRRTAVDKGVSLINNIKVAKLFIESLQYLAEKGKLDIRSYEEITSES